jgi:hypothetical protein
MLNILNNGLAKYVNAAGRWKGTAVKPVLLIGGQEFLRHFEGRQEFSALFRNVCSFHFFSRNR